MPAAAAVDEDDVDEGAGAVEAGVIACVVEVVIEVAAGEGMEVEEVAAAAEAAAFVVFGGNVAVETQPVLAVPV